jgi:hypothetical protein
MDAVKGALSRSPLLGHRGGHPSPVSTFTRKSARSGGRLLLFPCAADAKRRHNGCFLPARGGEVAYQEQGDLKTRKLSTDLRWRNVEG